MGFQEFRGLRRRLVLSLFDVINGGPYNKQADGRKDIFDTGHKETPFLCI